MCGGIAKPYNLLNLNDDCIYEILSYMTEDDLIALKNSCRRLDKLTLDFVRREYRRKLFELQSTNQSHNYFREFGPIFTRLSIDINKLHDEQLFFQNFENLCELSIFDIKISEDFVNQTSVLCRNLEYLSISSSYIDIHTNYLRRFLQACIEMGTQENPRGKKNKN